MTQTLCQKDNENIVKNKTRVLYAFIVSFFRIRKKVNKEVAMVNLFLHATNYSKGKHRVRNIDNTLDTILCKVFFYNTK